MRSGTLLEGSKLPVSYFLITLHLLQEKGDNVTTEELQRVTHHKYYDPLWLFLRRIKSEIKKEGCNLIINDFNNVANEIILSNSEMEVFVSDK